MRRATLAAGVLTLAVAATAYASRTTQVLVSSSGTPFPALSGRTQVEMQNNGPEPICCVIGTSITGSACRVVSGVPDGGSHGGTWALSVRDSMPLRCKALGASQVDGGATIFTEIQ